MSIDPAFLISFIALAVSIGGIIYSQGYKSGKVDTKLEEHNKILEKIEGKLDNITERILKIEERVNTMWNWFQGRASSGGDPEFHEEFAQAVKKVLPEVYDIEIFLLQDSKIKPIRDKDEIVDESWIVINCSVRVKHIDIRFTFKAKAKKIRDKFVFLFSDDLIEEISGKEFYTRELKRSTEFLIGYISVEARIILGVLENMLTPTPIPK